MMEIVLLIAGGIIFILSFFIPDKKQASGMQDGNAEGARGLAEGELKGLISQEMDSIRTHVDEVVEEAVTYAMEKTERSLERLSNEKIMAVSEYSDTVLAEIHKNHEEAMFLYDMLNNKHINLKNTVSEVNRTVKEAEATVMNFQKLAPETLSASEERVLSQPAEPARSREPGVARTGTEMPGTAKSGLERAGARTGLDRIRTERAGKEMSGISGTGKPGQEGTGAGGFGSGSLGQEGAGAGGFGSGSLGQEGAGAGGFGTGRPGQEGAGAGGFGTGRPGTGVAGAGRTGTDQAGTGKSGLERLGASSESVSLGKVSFMQDVDDQGRNNNERILELFQQGRSTVAIARELGLGVGEVKLVIDLFRNQ